MEAARQQTALDVSVGRQLGMSAWDGCSHLLLGAHQRPQLLHRLTQLLSAGLSSSRVSQLSLQLCHLAHKHPDKLFKTGSELTGSSQWENCAVHHRRGLVSPLKMSANKVADVIRLVIFLLPFILDWKNKLMFNGFSFLL